MRGKLIPLRFNELLDAALFESAYAEADKLRRRQNMSLSSSNTQAAMNETIPIVTYKARRSSHRLLLMSLSCLGKAQL
jgi:hypothetical protein